MVCFMRPFTKSDLQVPRKYFPKGKDLDHLEDIKAHRDKVYAHSDAEAGRSAEAVSYSIGDDEMISMHFRESWNALNREVVPEFVALCYRIEDDFVKDAGAIQLLVDGQ